MRKNIEIHEYEYTSEDFVFDGDDTFETENCNVKAKFNPTNILDVGFFGCDMQIVDTSDEHCLCGFYIVSSQQLDLNNNLSFSFEYSENPFFNKRIFANDIYFDEVYANNKYYYICSYNSNFQYELNLRLKDHINDSEPYVRDLVSEYSTNYLYENEVIDYQYDDYDGFEYSDIFIRENEVKLTDLMSSNFWNKISKIIFSLYYENIDKYRILNQ